MLHPPHPRPRGPRRAAIITAAAATVALLAAVAGCTSASPAASTKTASPLPTAAATMHLAGAGSTFDAPFFGQAFTRYQQAHPGVAVSYAPVGSSAGITAFTGGRVNFGATDVPASPSDLAAARGGAAVQVPVDLGAVVVAYNLQLPGGPRLHLTGPVVARIFLGQVTRWNDPAITSLNPGIDLPNVAISVVHRADGSGTTYIFSNYLSATSPAWAAKVGTGRSLHWPTGVGGNGNPGVASAISRTPFSIGYIERSYLAGPVVGYAAIRNQVGNYTTPTSQAIAADAADKPAITPTSFSIVNQPSPAAYPICGYSWVLLSTRQPSQATGQALVTLIDWLTHAGQADAATLGYVPLPPAVQQLAHTTLQRVSGPSGQPLTG